MIPFVILLILPILTQHIKIGNGYVNHEKKNIRALQIFFVILTAMVMLRHESVGRDTAEYIYYFNQIRMMPWKHISRSEFEIGFVILNKIIGYVTDEPQVYLVIVAIVTTALIFPTYKRLCTDASLTIVLFCTMSTFLMFFSGIRQMLAIGIGFTAYEFTRNKRLIPFLITVIIATAFHTSAFMLLCMYPLYRAKVTKKSLFVVVSGLVAVFAFNKQIFSSLTFVLERYTKYDAIMTQTGAYTMIILFAAFLVFAFVITDESKLDEETIGLRNFLIFSLALQMFAPLHMLAMRMNYYYIIFIPLLIPKIIACRTERWSQVAIVGRHVMVIFFFAYFFITALSGGGLDVFPYHFFWENVL